MSIAPLMGLNSSFAIDNANFFSIPKRSRLANKYDCMAGGRETGLACNGKMVTSVIVYFALVAHYYEG